MAKQQQERKRLRIDQLEPHPKQREYYDDLDPATAEDLRAQVEAGRVDPIHVVPRENRGTGETIYTIFDGHQRVEQHRQLGRKVVEAIIRHDIAAMEYREREAEFLKFNLVRRQLHTLDRARIAMQIYYLEQPPFDDDGNYRDEDARQPMTEELRERIGALIGMSGRNLSRYIAVLRTPREIQRLVRDGQVPLVLGARVAQLDDDDQEELAVELTLLDDAAHAKQVVKEWLDDHVRRRKPGPRPRVKHSLQRLATALRHGRDEIRYQDLIAPDWRRMFLDDLATSTEWLVGLVERLRSIDPDSDPLLDELRDADNADEPDDDDADAE